MMKPAPRRPQIAPVIKLLGIVLIDGAVMGLVPNLSTEDDTVLIYSPSNNAFSIASVNTAIAQEKNTFQTTENFQKVFGLEIS